MLITEEVTHPRIWLKFSLICIILYIVLSLIQLLLKVHCILKYMYSLCLTICH